MFVYFNVVHRPFPSSSIASLLSWRIKGGGREGEIGEKNKARKKGGGTDLSVFSLSQDSHPPFMRLLRRLVNRRPAYPSRQ